MRDETRRGSYTIQVKRGKPRRTKIICTLGPATSSPKMIRELIRSGMNVARINCSHGSAEERKAWFNTVRDVASEMNRSIAILFDLSGQKMRVGKLEGGSLELNEGEKVSFVRGDGLGRKDALTSTYPGLLDDVQAGDQIYLDDGNLRLLATGKSEERLECRVEIGGTLLERKGLNLPGSTVSAPSLTEKDKEDVKLGVELGADFFALSFVRTPQNVNDLRDMLTDLGSNALIVSKIEKPQALDHLEAIIDTSDAVMVARGDLGIELPVEQVPSVQKRIIRECRNGLTPVIVATQMLESMVHAARPTRAEVSDVANAIEDGCDAVMLSAETTIGEYPLEATATMAKVAYDTEVDILQRRPETEFHESSAGDPLRKAMVSGATQIATALNAKFVVLRPESGETARYFSKLRGSAPIVAVNPDDKVLRRHALYWGVLQLNTNTAVEDSPSMEAELEYLARALLERGYATFKDHIVVVSRYPWGERLAPNSIRAVKIDEVIGTS